jgi:aryl-alcohol dehydrogenase-like predicted oxidoreductase
MDLVNLRLLEGEGGPEVPLAEQLGALEDLRREGKLELIGISNVSRAQAEEALELVDVAGVQNAYSILDRSGEDVLELSRERDIAFVPFFPLGSAFTGGPAKLAADPAIARVAAKHDATPSQIALAWLLHRDEQILLIPGTTSVAHLEENLAAADVTLDADDLADLDGVTPAGNPLETVTHGA